MQLTMFTDYGLRTLMFLASNQSRLCNVKEIAEHFNISRNHLVKVVHKLAQLEYINTTKGKGGGIMLNLKPASVRLGDLVRALEPNMNLVECFDKKTNTCLMINTCKLKHRLMNANHAFIDSLNESTLEDII